MGGMHPGDVVVPSDDQLLADPLDLDLARTLPHAQRLNGQPLALAGWLGNIAGGRHLGAVELAHHLTALFHLADIRDEHGLMDDRASRAFLVHHGLDGFQSIVDLLAQAAGSAGNGGRVNMADVVQFHDGKTNPSMRHLADRVVSHEELLPGKRKRSFVAGSSYRRAGLAVQTPELYATGVETT